MRRTHWFHPFRVNKNLQYMCQNESQIERLGFLWRVWKSKCPVFPQTERCFLSYCMKRNCLRMSQSDEHSIDRNRMEVLTAGRKPKPMSLACFYPVRWGLTTFVYFLFVLCWEHLNGRKKTNNFQPVVSLVQQEDKI